jgi:hypothetical protein
VCELYAALRGVVGFGPDPEFAPARAGELARIALDPGLAARLLRWRPPHQPGRWAGAHLGVGLPGGSCRERQRMNQ